MRMVTINGKSYIVRLTVGALKRFKEQTGLELDQVNSVEKIICLLFFCLSTEVPSDTLPWKSADELMEDVELAGIPAISNALFGDQTQDPDAKNGIASASTV